MLTCVPLLEAGPAATQAIRKRERSTSEDSDSLAQNTSTTSSEAPVKLERADSTRSVVSEKTTIKRQRTSSSDFAALTRKAKVGLLKAGPSVTPDCSLSEDDGEVWALVRKAKGKTWK